MVARSTIWRFRFGDENFHFGSDNANHGRHAAHFEAAFSASVFECGPGPSTEVTEPRPWLDLQEWLADLLKGLAGELGKLGYGVFHGALLEHADGAMIVAGPSTAGKSFFSLGLSRQGLRVLADDMSFLKVDGEFIKIVPVPKFIQSRALEYVGVRRAPDRSDSFRFELGRLTLIFPQPRASRNAIEPLREPSEIFLRLSNANVFCGGETARQLVPLQLGLRRKLSERCPAWVHHYSDVEPPRFSELLVLQ